MKGVNAIEGVYRAYFDAVYRYALRLTGGDAALADDITSDTFMAAMRGIGRFRGDSSIKSWLCQIARHRYIDHLRKQGRVCAAVDLPEQPDTDTPEDHLIRKEKTDAALRAIDGLPEPYREIFLLRYRDEMGFQEIGRLYRRSANWACVCYHRARQKLIQAIKEEEE